MLALLCGLTPSPPAPSEGCGDVDVFPLGALLPGVRVCMRACVCVRNNKRIECKEPLLTHGHFCLYSDKHEWLQSAPGKPSNLGDFVRVSEVADTSPMSKGLQSALSQFLLGQGYSICLSVLLCVG